MTERSKGKRRKQLRLPVTLERHVSDFPLCDFLRVTGRKAIGPARRGGEKSDATTTLSQSETSARNVVTRPRGPRNKVDVRENDGLRFPREIYDD